MNDNTKKYKSIPNMKIKYSNFKFIYFIIFKKISFVLLSQKWLIH